jgi:hypothetical protein
MELSPWFPGFTLTMRAVLSSRLDHVRAGGCLLVVVTKEGIDISGVVGFDGAGLDKAVLLNDRVGELEESTSVEVQIVSLGLRQDSLVKLRNVKAVFRKKPCAASCSFGSQRRLTYRQKLSASG